MQKPRQTHIERVFTRISSDINSYYKINISCIKSNYFTCFKPIWRYLNY